MDAETKKKLLQETLYQQSLGNITQKYKFRQKLAESYR
jgi:hypothetical protein